MFLYVKSIPTNKISVWISPQLKLYYREGDDEMDRKLNLYIVRQGETYLNRYSKLQGWSDSPLTEEEKRLRLKRGNG